MKIRTYLRCSSILMAVMLPLAASAHVNSPDVYFDGQAGPYRLLVTTRLPTVVPGIAQIEIRTLGNDVDRIEIVPLRISGPGASLAPTPDAAERSSADPRIFHGKLWIMGRGSWKIRVTVDGKQGAAELDVPLTAVSVNSVKMQTALGGLLSFLGLALIAGMVGIAGAATREVKLQPGMDPTPVDKRRSYRTMGFATVFIVAVVMLANWWWSVDARANERLNYITPQAQTFLEAGSLLRVQLENPNSIERALSPGALARVKRMNLPIGDSLGTVVMDDLIPDHGHIMHLFLVRMPDMRSFWHLHPDQSGEGQFADRLPTLPAGHYQIYADIVHHDGFPETQVSTIDLPSISGEPLHGDDSGASDLAPSDHVAQLSDGYRMVWERDANSIKVDQPTWFRFRVEDPTGQPAVLENYMGMAGHAVFVSIDGKVFAHVHPSGSVPMAAVRLAEGAEHNQEMPGMAQGPVNGEVTFPYGLPQPGDYRIFVQVKRAGRVETGEFAAHAEH